MSLEAAKKLLSEVKKEDFIGKSQEELEKFLKESGYDCTLEEVKKAYILAEPLSENELEKVTGGEYFNKQKCTGDFYVEECTDTVERFSSCWSGDDTYKKYTCTKTAIDPVQPGIGF